MMMYLLVSEVCLEQTSGQKNEEYPCNSETFSHIIQLTGPDKNIVSCD